MFNIENFDIKLETNFVGRNFIYSEESESSNSYLLEKPNNFKNGTVYLTEYQNSGKGRLNRPWHSNKGQNLTFSILISENIDEYNPNFINLAASLAVSSSIENLYQVKTLLKWPNDVLVDNKKISGILLESISQSGEINKIVVGIGVNVNQTKFVGDFRLQPTSIKFELKKEINRERLLSEILNTFEEYMEQSRKNSKLFLDEWRERCRMIGEHVSVETSTEKKFGIFYDIDANGLMILKSGEHLEKINSGDITIVQ